MDTQADITNQDEVTISEEKQYLISEANFQRLRQLQQDIFIATDISPSIRKLINAILTEENLQQLKANLIAQYQ